MERAEDETLVLHDPALGLYKKLVLHAGRLIGAVLFGDTRDALWYLSLIREGCDVTRFHYDLVFGRAHCERLDKTGFTALTALVPMMSSATPRSLPSVASSGG